MYLCTVMESPQYTKIPSESKSTPAAKPRNFHLLALSLILINIASSYCFATYEIFHGFWDIFNSSENLPITTAEDLFQGIFSSTPSPTSTSVKSTTTNLSLIHPGDNSTGQSVTTQTTKKLKYKCPEEELPSNIGPYEVPTERDLALHVKETLTAMFESYHAKAFYFLKDIKEVTKATIDIENKCTNKVAYRKCVKQVSAQCEYFTKNLVAALEKQRQDVGNITEEAICNVTSMKTDPIKLIKILAMEESTLEFALPGFLRLLNRCSSYCSISSNEKYVTKPPRHLSDKDLVVMYFLSKNHYLEPVKKPNPKL